MNMSSNRLEAFSDGVMAIIITIVVLEIPLPSDINLASMLELLYTILVFFVTFVIVGSQWVKHHFIFERCEKISNKILWQNIIYLFFLSLLPLFTKWIMENPSEVVPALALNIISICIFTSFGFLSRTIISENKELEKFHIERLEMRKGHSVIRNNRKIFLIYSLVFIIVLILFVFLVSVIYPSLTIFFFVMLPVINSLFNLWIDGDIVRERRKMQLKTKN